MITGKKIARALEIISHHSLYRKDGLWYHHLKFFPGILADYDGFVIFQNREEYESHPCLQHANDLHVVNGIKSIRGYIPFTEEEKKLVVAL